MPLFLLLSNLQQGGKHEEPTGLPPSSTLLHGHHASGPTPSAGQPEGFTSKSFKNMPEPSYRFLTWNSIRICHISCRWALCARPQVSPVAWPAPHTLPAARTSNEKTKRTTRTRPSPTSPTTRRRSPRRAVERGKPALLPPRRMSRTRKAIASSANPPHPAEENFLVTIPCVPLLCPDDVRYITMLTPTLPFVSRFQKGGVDPPDALWPFRPERWVSFSNETMTLVVLCVGFWPDSTLKAHVLETHVF